MCLKDARYLITYLKLSQYSDVLKFQDLRNSKLIDIFVKSVQLANIFSLREIGFSV